MTLSDAIPTSEGLVGKLGWPHDGPVELALLNCLRARAQRCSVLRLGGDPGLRTDGARGGRRVGIAAHVPVFQKRAPTAHCAPR